MKDFPDNAAHGVFEKSSQFNVGGVCAKLIFLRRCCTLHITSSLLLFHTAVCISFLGFDNEKKLALGR